jgi:DNA-binding transcriptional LysR family regulator
MEVRQARHFLAVVDHGTTGRAAAELHMTQPALSQSIVALERELRVRLFLRSTQGMALTPAGEALVGPARRLVESSVRAVAAVEQSIDVPHGTLNLTVMPALAATPVSTWIGWFRDTYPQVSVRLSPYFGDETVARVFDRDYAEILVSFVGEPGPGQMQRLEVGSQEMIVALPPGTRVVNGPTVQLKDIAHLPFVVAPPHTSMQRILQEAFDQIGSTLAVAVETPFMDTMPALVAAGAGCAIFPARGAEALRALGAVVKHPDPPVHRPYYLFYAAHRLSYAAQAFVRTATSERRPRRPAS